MCVGIPIRGPELIGRPFMRHRDGVAPLVTVPVYFVVGHRKRHERHAKQRGENRTMDAAPLQHGLTRVYSVSIRATRRAAFHRDRASMIAIHALQKMLGHVQNAPANTCGRRRLNVQRE